MATEIKAPVGPSSRDEEALVAAAYRGILGLEPGALGLRQYVAALRGGKDPKLIIGCGSALGRMSGGGVEDRARLSSRQ